MTLDTCEELIACRGCGDAKTTEEFPRDPSRRSGRSGRCKACHRKRVGAWRAQNPELAKQRQRESYARHRDSWVRRRIAAKHGITVEAAWAIYESQDRACGICHRQITFGQGQGVDSGHLDHDHQSNTVRGFLCVNCNKGLGMFSDDADRMVAAIAYLQRDIKA